MTNDTHIPIYKNLNMQAEYWRCRAVDAEQQRDELLAENEKMRDLLLLTLYNHQGANSPIGQLIRRCLGIGPLDRLTGEQIDKARQVRDERTTHTKNIRFRASIREAILYILLRPNDCAAHCRDGVAADILSYARQMTHNAPHKGLSEAKSSRRRP